MRKKRTRGNVSYNTCGDCDRAACDAYWVWNPHEHHRVLMCSATARAVLLMRHTAALPVGLSSGGLGECCAMCEEDIAGARAPAIVADGCPFCRHCATDIDEAVFCQGEARVNTCTRAGEAEMHISAAAWSVLRLASGRSVRRTRAAFDRVLHNNLDVVDGLVAAFAAFSLGDT